MNYTKPTIVALSTASAAIQGNGIKGTVPVDADTGQSNPLSTGNSYDLDE
jgi:hypothetical protein